MIQVCCCLPRIPNVQARKKIAAGLPAADQHEQDCWFVVIDVPYLPSMNQSFVPSLLYSTVMTIRTAPQSSLAPYFSFHLSQQ